MPKLGLDSSILISSWALHTLDAMVLLYIRVNPLLIQMIGRWTFDAMFGYFYLQSTNMHNLTTCMLSRDKFNLFPNQMLPHQVLSLPSLTPSAAMLP
jgi:hypothetical protein